MFETNLTFSLDCYILLVTYLTTMQTFKQKGFLCGVIRSSLAIGDELKPTVQFQPISLFSNIAQQSAALYGTHIFLLKAHLAISAM